jgi:hypothetical protein
MHISRLSSVVHTDHTTRIGDDENQSYIVMVMVMIMIIHRNGDGDDYDHTS